MRRDKKAPDKKAYAAPTVKDYGTLLQMTQATAFTGAEDGGSKLLIHHDLPAISVGVLP